MPSVAYKKPRSVAVIGDLHGLEHDARAVAVAFMVCRQEQPEVIYCNGDWLDCTSLQKNNRMHPASFASGENPLPFSAEVVFCRMLLERLRADCPDSRIVFVEGNHEQRIGRLLGSAMPQLYGLVPPLQAMLQLDQLGIEFQSARESSVIGDTIITHGQRCNIHAGRSAMLDDWGQSVMMGHTHRLKMYSKGFGTGRVIYGCECGHLRNRGASYTPRLYPDWQQGFGWLTEHHSGVYQPSLVPIIDGTAVFPGKLYYARQRDVDRLFGPINERIGAQATQLVTDIVNGNLWRVK